MDVDVDVCGNWETTTSNETTVFWKSFVELCESMEKNLIVSELDYGLENHCSRETTQQTTDTDKHAKKTRVLRKTTTIDDKHKNTVVKLAPLL